MGGLFTSNTSVQDLLEQRSQRSTNLQQQLMQQASQGARDPAKAQAISMLGSTFGRALAGKVGGADERMEKLKADEAQQELMRKEYGAALTSDDPKLKMDTAHKLIDLGYVEYGGTLRAEAVSDANAVKAAAVQKASAIAEQERREKLITVATGLGLKDTAALLQDGGDLEEAGKAIRAQEKLKVLQGGNRNSRALMAKQYGKSEAYIKEVLNGKHDTVTDDMFLKVLEGKEAKLTNYMNKAGNSQLYRVDAQGKVWNPNSSSWVFPSELGLSAAPQQTQEVMSMFDQVTTALVSADITNYQELNTQANDALGGLDINYNSQKILDEGIISGKFSEVRIGLNKALIATGMASEEAEEITANSETYMAYRGNAVANIIKAFGAGTGLSDADRNYAVSMAGAGVTMTEGAMQKLLRLERQMYTYQIKENNKVVKRMVDRIEGTDVEKQEMALAFYIAEPTPYEPKVEEAPVLTWNATTGKFE